MDVRKTDKKECLECGGNVDADAKSCPHCGGTDFGDVKKGDSGQVVMPMSADLTKAEGMKCCAECGQECPEAASSCPECGCSEFREDADKRALTITSDIPGAADMTKANDGIRPYGPGKFEGGYHIDAFVHALALFGDDLGDEYFGSYTRVGGPLLDEVERVASEEKDTLTDEEKQLLSESMGGAILFFQDNGFVDVTYYDTEADADADWNDLEEQYEKYREENPDEDTDEPEEVQESVRLSKDDDAYSGPPAAYRRGSAQVRNIQGKDVLYSYDTPVAYQDDSGVYVTDKKFSVTTSKQIKQWLQSLGNPESTTVSQEKIESLSKSTMKSRLRKARDESERAASAFSAMEDFHSSLTLTTGSSYREMEAAAWGDLVESFSRYQKMLLDLPAKRTKSIRKALNSTQMAEMTQAIDSIRNIANSLDPESSETGADHAILSSTVEKLGQFMYGQKHGFEQKSARVRKAKYEVGDRVQLSSDAIDNYGSEWEGKTLVVTNVATQYMPASEFYSRDMPAGYHPGYDEAAGAGGLYSLETEDGESLNFDVYDWELEPAEEPTREQESRRIRKSVRPSLHKSDFRLEGNTIVSGTYKRTYSTPQDAQKVMEHLTKALTKGRVSKAACHKCGSMVAKGSPKCPECGAKVGKAMTMYNPGGIPTGSFSKV